MTKEEWTLACSNCGAEVFRSVPIEKPKMGDYLIADQWVNVNGNMCKVGDPYVCGTCCTWFQPILECLSVKGDDND